MSECKFELSEIRCVECGKPTGDIGTCDDRAYCSECRTIFEKLKGKNAFARYVVRLIEREKYHPKSRVLHFDSGSNLPLCAARGGPHPLSKNINEVNCKKCLRKSVTAKVAA
jgi:hypothetical protein